MELKMKLDRNLNENGKGKYALINLRKIAGNPQTPQELAAEILANPQCVEFGLVGSQDEFWVIKLKDKYAYASLHAYASAAAQDDPEYADQVSDLANRAGKNSPFCKTPD